MSDAVTVILMSAVVAMTAVCCSSCDSDICSSSSDSDVCSSSYYHDIHICCHFCSSHNSDTYIGNEAVS